MKADNDNEEFSFISLAALTANVLQHLGLNEKQKEEPERQKDSSDTRSDYIEQRVAEIEAFERRANGMRQRPRRKRE